MTDAQEHHDRIIPIGSASVIIAPPNTSHETALHVRVSGAKGNPSAILEYLQGDLEKTCALTGNLVEATPDKRGIGCHFRTYHQEWASAKKDNYHSAESLFPYVILAANELKDRVEGQGLSIKDAIAALGGPSYQVELSGPILTDQFSRAYMDTSGIK